MSEKDRREMRIISGILLQFVFGYVCASGQDVLRDNPGLNTETQRMECAVPSIDLTCLNTTRDRELVFTDLKKGWPFRDLGIEEVTQKNGDKIIYHSLMGKSEENYYYVIVFWNPGDASTQISVIGSKSLLIRKPLAYLSYQEAGLLIRSINTQLGIFGIYNDKLKPTECVKFIEDNTFFDLQKQYESLFFQKILKCVVKIDGSGAQIVFETDRDIKIYSNNGEITQVDRLPDLGEK